MITAPQGVFLEVLFELFDVLDGLLSGSGDFLVPEGVEGSSGLFVFLEDLPSVNNKFGAELPVVLCLLPFFSEKNKYQ